MKTKALISCVVTTQLICAFVFAYAKSRFCHDVKYLKCCRNQENYTEYILKSLTNLQIWCNHSKIFSLKRELSLFVSQDMSVKIFDRFSMYMYYLCILFNEIIIKEFLFKFISVIMYHCHLIEVDICFISQ